MNILVQFITTSDILKREYNERFRVKGFDNASEALAFVEREKPNVIVLEYDLEKHNTEIFIKTILVESPESKIVLLGKSLSDDHIIQCLSQGVLGYLDFKEIDKFLGKAIKSVTMGEAWVSRKLVGLLIESIRG